MHREWWICNNLESVRGTSREEIDDRRMASTSGHKRNGSSSSMFAHKRTESGGGFVGYKRTEGGHKRAESISSAFGHKRSESGHKRNESSGGFGHKRWFTRSIEINGSKAPVLSWLVSTFVVEKIASEGQPNVNLVPVMVALSCSPQYNRK